jgi:aminopeptidase N
MQSLRPTRLTIRALTLLLLLALVGPQLAAARPAPRVRRQQQQQQAQQPRIPPRQYLPERSYDTRHIKLDLHFDWEREQAIGTATITFAPLNANTKTVEFDAANMTFKSVTLASGAPLKFEPDAGREKLRVTLDRAYQPADVLTVVISYNTNGVTQGGGLVGFGRGLAFIKPTPDDTKRPKQIWSQGETEYNHFWFPCFDHPNDFATTEMIATVEKPLMVISNGKLLETKSNADGTRTFHWTMEQPHASYLTSIVVGEYAAVEGSYQGIPVITYVYPNEVEEGKVTAARLPEMVQFFSEKTGLKYPYAKYAQTMTRDFGGGMENITATTQTDQMIHDRRTELDRDSDGLQSHELAHQWFGDYVTCRAWSDIWLNESFATYFQAMWDEHRLGRDAFLYQDVKNNQDAYLNSWRQNYRRPIVTSNYADKDNIFDNYAYPRGGAVLHMLRKALGDDDWWRSINHYLTKYAHQPVETEQFRIAIEETTGKPMDWFFDQWLYKMGHPVFNVTRSYDAATKQLTLKVRQEQKPDPSSDYPQVTFFRAPLEIEIEAGGNRRIESIVVEPKEEQTFTFAADAEPQLVHFDYGSTVIKEVTFEKPTNELAYQLTRDDDVTGRVWALNQLKTRLEAKETAADEKQRIVATLAAAVSGEKFWGVRSELATALAGQNAAEARNALLAATKDADARVRASAVGALAKSKDEQLASVYLGLLSDQSYGVIRAAANALGETKSPQAYDALMKLVDAPSWRDQVRASALQGLAALGDKRALELGLRYAAGGNDPQVRAAAITLLASVGRDDPRTFPLVSEAFLHSVDTLNFPIGNAAGEALVKLGDPRGVEVIEQAIKKVNSQQIQGFIRQFQQRLQQALKPEAQKPAGQ